MSIVDVDNDVGIDLHREKQCPCSRRPVASTRACQVYALGHTSPAGGRCTRGRWTPGQARMLALDKRLASSPACSLDGRKRFA